MFKKLRDYLSIREFNKTYRIVEVNGKFIAQHYDAGWEGIDRGDDPAADEYANMTWTSQTAQAANCAWDTYEEANERLLKYIDYLRKKTPKIHKVTLEPEAWRRLKDKA